MSATAARSSSRSASNASSTRGCSSGRHLAERPVDPSDVACEVCRPGLQCIERLLDTARHAFEALGERRDSSLDVLRPGERRLDPPRELLDSLVDPLERLVRLDPASQIRDGFLQARGVLRLILWGGRAARRPGTGRGEMAMDAAGSDHCSARALASSRRVIAPWPTRICPSGCCVRSCSAVASASCSASTNPWASRMSPIRRFAAVSLRGTALTVSERLPGGRSWGREVTWSGGRAHILRIGRGVARLAHSSQGRERHAGYG